MRCKDAQLLWARTSLINFPWSEEPGEFFIYGQKPSQYVRHSYEEIIITIIIIIVYIANLLIRSAKIGCLYTLFQLVRVKMNLILAYRNYHDFKEMV